VPIRAAIPGGDHLTSRSTRAGQSGLLRAVNVCPRPVGPPSFGVKRRTDEASRHSVWLANRGLGSPAGPASHAGGLHEAGRAAGEGIARQAGEVGRTEEAALAPTSDLAVDPRHARIRDRSFRGSRRRVHRSEQSRRGQPISHAHQDAIKTTADLAEQTSLLRQRSMLTPRG
jgi:hypothetical protein